VAANEYSGIYRFRNINAIETAAAWVPALKMKIVKLNYYQGIMQRGLEIVVYERARKLAAKGQDVLVIQGGEKANEEVREGVRYRTIPFRYREDPHTETLSIRRRLFLNPRSMDIAKFSVDAFKVLDDFRPDVVTALNNGWQSLLMRLWSWKHKCKLVFWGASGIGWDDRVSIFMHPDLFITKSPRAYVWAKRFALCRLEMIPNGVNVDEFKPDGEVFRTYLQRPIVLTASALTAQKQTDRVVRAMAQVPEASLLIVGNGPEHDRLKQLVDELLPGRCQILPGVPYKQMPMIYRSADAFIMVSASSEALGNVYLEAMATGLPTVATDDPQRRFVLGPKGIFVKPDDTNAVAQAIRQSLTAKTQAEMILQSRNFNWDETTERYLLLLRQITGKS
jgi:glycosyltransferase involved in cell wall biosynthesis